MRHIAAKLILLAVLSDVCAASAEPRPILGLDTGGHMALIRAVLFTPDGQRLISAGDDRVIRIWNTGNGKTVQTLRGEISEEGLGKIYALAISPDGRWLAAAGDLPKTQAGRQPIRLYDLSTGEIAALFGGDGDIILA